MLKNYLVVTLRNVRRSPGYAFITVSGLAVGLACVLLIALYVRSELSYDRHHTYADRIVRFTVSDDRAVTPSALAPTLQREVPGVVAAARIYDLGRFRTVVLRRGTTMFEERAFMLADSTVFDVFTLPMLAGSPETALTRPYTVVLTASAARKYFGDEDPVGQVLETDLGRPYEVTGVIEDMPATSHLRFDMLGSFASSSWAEREVWNSANFFTYARLQSPEHMAGVQEALDARVAQMRRANPEMVPDEYRVRLQPLTSIHLDVEGGRTYVYLFSAIAALVLLIACINYVNLATARAQRRAKEVGVRKAAGAGRGQLMGQFFGESALLVGFALVLAVLLAEAALPGFNALAQQALDIHYLSDPFFVPGLLAIGLVVTLVAGSYPALLLSSFRPAAVLKGTFHGGRGGVWFRRSLVVFQFAVSVLLLVATLVVARQLDFVQTKHLGFRGDQVVVLPLSGEASERREALKEALLQDPAIASVSAVNAHPGGTYGGWRFVTEGQDLPAGEFAPIHGTQVDGDAVETLGLELVAGPGFPPSAPEEPEDGAYRYLLNESAAQQAGWTPEEAIGKRMAVNGRTAGEVVGVVRDFHFASLHEEIHPLALWIDGRNFRRLLVKVDGAELPAALRHVEATVRQFAPDRPYEHAFLDATFAAQYQAEERIGRVYGVFAVLAIGIACLGLLGLAAFAAEQRTKEIGVRKVLGASVPGIVALFARDFAALAVGGFLVAAPIGYLLMERWLAGFAYRVDLGVGPFLVAGLGVLALALVTVSRLAVKAALTNPAQALRYE